MSRGTWEIDWKASTVFAYRTITFCGRTFQFIRLAFRFVTPRSRRDGTMPIPATPDVQRSRAVTYVRFRLFPFRSPLLGESQLLSFPGGTEMVHFPPFASRLLWIRRRMAGVTSGRVAPLGNPRVKACLRLSGAYRS